MTIKMTDSRLQTILQIKEFIKANNFDFKIESKSEAYEWAQSTLIRFCYFTLSKNNKGTLKKYLGQITGYSRSQITRLVKQYVKTGRIDLKIYERYKPNKRYSLEDIKLIATTDEIHNNPSGSATKTILQREFKVFKKIEYSNISNISVAHIYNIRKKKSYKIVNKTFNFTKPSIVSIGERSKPNPKGKPGFLRVDTVHQGDKNLEKGVYHVNTIDEVTQFEIIGSVEKISDRYLEPLLERILKTYPFNIIEFHSDNGGEYINLVIVAMLNKLLIKLTKSRPRKTNDNALVEGKNGWIVRKFMGYMHIEQKYAPMINEFYFNIFNNYLNYHRPCAYSVAIIDKKGKVRKVYYQKDYMTPYDKLKSIPKSQEYLKEGITFELLDEVAYAQSDNEYATKMNEARRKLFNNIRLPERILKL